MSRGIPEGFLLSNGLHQACERCVKSKIVCPGYLTEPGYVFRNATATPIGHFSVGSEVKAGPRHPRPITLMSADDQLVNDSVNSFYDDYVVVSANPAVSRGFLDGIQHLIRFAGESSDVAQAARVVALGGVANRLGRLDLLNRSRSMYGTLLRSFQKTLLDPRTSNTMESLMIATLLGIYEVSWATIFMLCAEHDTGHIRY